MLVNISYTVELEDVPKKVSSILKEDIKKFFVDLTQEVDFVVDELEEENLTKSILMIRDCHNILVGYHEQLVKVGEESEPPADFDVQGAEEVLEKYNKITEEIMSKDEFKNGGFGVDTSRRSTTQASD